MKDDSGKIYQLRKILKKRGCFSVTCSECSIDAQCSSILLDISKSPLCQRNTLFTSTPNCTFTDEVFEKLIKKLLAENIITEDELFEILL